jgi:hypothetical protein
MSATFIQSVDPNATASVNTAPDPFDVASLRLDQAKACPDRHSRRLKDY